MDRFAPLARFGGRLATGLLDVTRDPSALDSEGFWAVVADFEGAVTCARFADVRTVPELPSEPSTWRGPRPTDWSTSLDREAYKAAVRRIREHIAAGEVYQANLCRVLSAPLTAEADIEELFHLLARHNPAPYAGLIRLPRHGLEVATASPSCFSAATARPSHPGRSRAPGAPRRTCSKRTTRRTS